MNHVLEFTKFVGLIVLLLSPIVKAVHINPLKIGNKKIYCLYQDNRYITEKKIFIISFPGKINEVLLFLHDDHYCGGNNIYIEIVQNGTFCITQTKNIFRGSSASWTGIQLSSCFEKDFNVWQENLYFRARTTDTNDFCPRNLTITLNNAKYQSDIMTDWVDNKKGGELRTARKILG